MPGFNKDERRTEISENRAIVERFFSHLWLDNVTISPFLQATPKQYLEFTIKSYVNRGRYGLHKFRCMATFNLEEPSL